MSVTMSAPPRNAQDLVDAVADLAPRFRERAPLTEAQRSVPWESMAELIEAGMARMLAPRAHGGLELDTRALVDATEAVAYGCPSTGWCAGQMAFAGWVVAHYPIAAQQKIWADGPDVVLASTAAGLTATSVPGGFRLSGRGAFASGIKNATWLYLGAFVTPPTGGAPAGPPDGRYFLLPKEQASVVETWDTQAMRGTGSNTVVVDDVFVPEDFTIRFADVREGLSPGSGNTGPLFVLPWATMAPLIYVATALGATQAAADTAIEALKGKVAPNGARAADSEQLQLDLSYALAKLDAGRDLLHGITTRVDSGEALTFEERARLLRDCNFIMTLLLDAVDSLVRLSGSGAFTDGGFLQQAWRDVHLAAAHQTLNKRLVVGRYAKVVLGLDEPVKPLFY